MPKKIKITLTGSSITDQKSNAQLMLPRGNDVAFVFVKLARKLGLNVADVETCIFLSQHSSCLQTMPIKQHTFEVIKFRTFDSAEHDDKQYIYFVEVISSYSFVKCFAIV